MIEHLRNIAIIAHVDHGKTTLVDRLLESSGTLGERSADVERRMDSNPLEKERGITILAKNTAVEWEKDGLQYRINIVDTPGHADFGGEVERILSMVDSVLLLVDAVDGPMPQTRFVTQKAFKQGLKPIVVINKIDRPGARPHWVVDQVFDLFDKLGATEAQLDFPIVYTSALLGYAVLEIDQPAVDFTPLFETILKYVPPPAVELNGSLQMQISSLQYSNYVGVIGIGRIKRGQISKNMQVSVVDRFGKVRMAKILQLWTFKGLEKKEVSEANAGDIIAVAGIEHLTISETICAKDNPDMLPPLSVDEPTITMTFQINDSPFVGREGKFVTSRQLRDRLFQELTHNIALRVEETADADKFKVSGRGELHLGILIETMRREGYELAVSRPEVILCEKDGVMQEPYEQLVLDVEETHQGTVMEKLGERRGRLTDMISDGKGRVRLDYIIPARGLIGFHTEFQNFTSGTGIMTHVFDHYGPVDKTAAKKRSLGVLISNGVGKSTAYSLWKLQERGRLFIHPQTEVYEGMLVGFHTRANDLVVNVTTEKQLTNMRASGSDAKIVLTPPIVFLSVEEALQAIESDELVEITPKSIRLRKRYLKENDRKRSER
ncbi:MAG: translational GTPase TypA [Gammaproteobacteria bacterium]|nr:translational GTPase TypA [Gammaproteobacteria bacterium]MBP9729748.1 translational GTPase TypA [Gammaproteobacteria bacterium]